MPFKKAVKEQVHGRIAFVGPAGSGKTWWALSFATRVGGKIALIDTERESAALYADHFEFDTLQMEPPYSPERYIDAINEAAKARYEWLVIDSLSHAWAGPGGLLEFVDDQTAKSKSKNAFTEGWRKATPIHNKLVDAILAYPGHVAVTLRSKVDYVVEKNERGKTDVRKVGLQPVQREGLDYEFTVVADIDTGHVCAIGKTRCFDLADKVWRTSSPTEAAQEMADIFKAWALSGEPPKAKPNGLAKKPPSVLAGQILAGLTKAFGDDEDTKVEWLNGLADKDALNYVTLDQKSLAQENKHDQLVGTLEALVKRVKGAA